LQRPGLFSRQLAVKTWFGIFCGAGRGFLVAVVLKEDLKMLNLSGKSSHEVIPAATSSLSYLSPGFSIIPPSPPLQVSSIWQRYRFGAASEKDLLQALSKHVAELEVLPPLMDGKFRMATYLAYAPCATRLEAADAIEAFIDWADSNDITVVDGTAA
jgi:hypothetical protein